MTPLREILCGLGSDQQQEQTRLLEWQSRLKRDETALLERQRILELKEADVQRRQNPWLNAQSSDSGFMSGENSAIGALAGTKKA